MTILTAIQILESASGVQPGTLELPEDPISEILDYVRWLRRQAPTTSIMIPPTEDLAFEELES